VTWLLYYYELQDLGNPIKMEHTDVFRDEGVDEQCPRLCVHEVWMIGGAQK
jgi:hypothetical protein